MSTPAPVTQIPVVAASDVVEDDPKVPVKAIVAAVVAVLAYLTAQGVELPVWLEHVLAVLAIGGSTYGAKNPKRVKGKHRRRNEAGYGGLDLLVRVVVFLVLLVVVVALVRALL
jgi:hypothetical protein